MSTTITQNSPVTGASQYSVSPDPDQPSSAPSISSSDTSGGGGLLPTLETSGSGDLATEMAILLAKSFREDRKHANESADLEELNRLREGEMRVAELHNKADEIRSEGLARGVSQICGAVCSGVGGGFALGDPKTADAYLSIWSGGGKAFDAGGNIIGSGYQANAVERQSEADLHESRGEASKVVRDKFTEEANDARQMATKMLEFVKEMNETRNATLQIAASLKA